MLLLTLCTSLSMNYFPSFIFKSLENFCILTYGQMLKNSRTFLEIFYLLHSKYIHYFILETAMNVVFSKIEMKMNNF